MLETLKTKIFNLLQLKWYTLSYHGCKLKFPFNPRKGICTICGRTGYTNIHHCCYNFSVKEVMKNNNLALLFTYETCYPDHELSNSMRKILVEDPNLVFKTNNKNLRKIYDLHIEKLAERDNYNEKQAKIMQKTAKTCWKMTK